MVTKEDLNKIDTIVKDIVNRNVSAGNLTHELGTGIYIVAMENISRTFEEDLKEETPEAPTNNKVTGDIL